MLSRSEVAADWQHHEAILRAGDKETNLLLEAVNWWASAAEDVLADVWETLPHDDSIETDRHLCGVVRGVWEVSYRSQVEPSVFLPPHLLVEAMYIFVAYWKYGELLAKSLTIFEQALVDSNVFAKLALLREQAERFDNSTTTGVAQDDVSE